MQRMVKRAYLPMLLLVVLAMLAAGCSDETETVLSAETSAGGGGSREVTDLAGRTVTVPADVERVVAVGSGALRLVVYADGADRVVGVEEFETRPPVSRPYTIANPELLELPLVGVGGPDSAVDAERLLAVEPDVIFIAQVADASGADELQAATHIPVIVVSYGDLGTIDEPFFTSLGLVGSVLGTTDHTADVVSRIRDTIVDLNERTADIPDEARPTAYVGALGLKGAHGIESTQAGYLPFGAIGARNVAADLGASSTIMIDLEQLLAWAPDHIFIDLGGLSLVRDDVKADRSFYEGLGAVRDGHVYGQLPFNSYSSNVELALADAYYVGTVLYPDRFADVDPVAIADELSEALVGAPVYDQLASAYGSGFGVLDLLGGE
ncbi:MAG: iron ABC transporter substrate-binding protein [Coriobacteriia bacterium]|nr:iron ABC transporter substrate-binding protein [Coriobacteriia bacterium]